MIRINKPKTSPRVLTTRGKAKRRAMSSAYTRASAKYINGSKKFDFDSGIYAHETVKAVLKSAQHDKCFLCESKVTHIAYGDVEHFRPKAACCQNEDDDLEKPGYFWLAYEWENLFFCCQLCNQRFKKNLFPLVDSSKRAKSHRDEIANEKPLFINPAEDNPEDYISFRAEIPYAINNNRKGKITIKNTGLDREPLNEKRRDYYDQLRLIFILANSSEPESGEAKAFLLRVIQDASEYAAMARAAIAAKFSII